MAAKTNKKQRKTSATGTVKESEKAVTGEKNLPTEEEIRELAEIIYHQRIDQGEHGTADDDWLKAEECLSKYSEL
jgi:hypothetical protein